MKPKTLVLMVVAVTCGLGASYMTSRLLAERNADDAEKVAVLVAKKQIDNGSQLKAPQDLFEEKLYVKGEEPRDALAKLEDLKGRIMKRTLRQGDFIRADDMLDSKDPQSFQANMPERTRAVGLRVNLEAIAAGLASLPHSRVDIIQTVRRGDDKTSYSQVILENVLVLAADQKTTRDEGGNAMPASIVTFALSTEDVLKLNLSREVGTLSLALRKFGDYSKSSVDKITMADIKNGTGGSHSGADAEENTDVAAANPAPVNGIPMLPIKPGEAVSPETVKNDAPAGRKHDLTVIEGDRARVISFQVDSQGRVVNQEVIRSGDVAAPVRPPFGEKTEE
jgi:pilus assembly protein CpaB